MASFVREESTFLAWLAGVPDRLQFLESSGCLHGGRVLRMVSSEWWHCNEGYFYSHDDLTTRVAFLFTVVKYTRRASAAQLCSGCGASGLWAIGYCRGRRIRGNLAVVFGVGFR